MTRIGCLIALDPRGYVLRISALVSSGLALPNLGKLLHSRPRASPTKSLCWLHVSEEARLRSCGKWMARAASPRHRSDQCMSDGICVWHVMTKNHRLKAPTKISSDQTALAWRFCPAGVAALRRGRDCSENIPCGPTQRAWVLC